MNIGFLPVHLQYAQKDIQRCSLAPKIQSYDLMQHSYGVLSICCDLIRLLEIQPLLQIEVELIMRHDIVETLTGDLPWNIKNLSDDTTNSWSKIEKEAVNSFSSEESNEILFYTDSNIEKNLSKDKLAIFKIADMLDLIFYCCKEKSLGNNSSKMDYIFCTAYKICKTRIFNFCKNEKQLKIFKDYIASSRYEELKNYLIG